MQNTSIPEPPRFGKLSKAEEIQYVQALWDRIADSGGEIPVPETHLRLAEERLAEYRRHPTQARSAYDVLERLSHESR